MSLALKSVVSRFSSSVVSRRAHQGVKMANRAKSEMPYTLTGKANLRPTVESEKLRLNWLTGQRVHGQEKKGDWGKTPQTLKGYEAYKEASRCIKCDPAPCRDACPSSVDISKFMYSASNRNWYGAAQMIKSDNELGLSCGSQCAVETLCASTCTLGDSLLGPINIGQVQEFAVRVLKESGVPQIVDPANRDKYQEKIALIGAGPASQSAATFLARMGYSNVTIFEKNKYGGGLVADQIPQHRQPHDYSEWELSQIEDLGVKIEYGTEFDGDFKELKKQGFKSIFLGTGLNKPMTVEDINIGNVEHSKEFLNAVCNATKPTLDPSNKQVLPKLSGHVVVLGFGDTALDCAQSAFRCGADRVSLCFRRGIADKRATETAFERGNDDGCDYLPYSSPEQVFLNENGEISGVSFKRATPTSNNKNPKYDYNGEGFFVSCDHVITAFGSENDQEWLDTIIHRRDSDSFLDNQTMEVKGMAGVFAGGDVTGSNESVVGAANDGKTAAWHMHKHIRESVGDIVPGIPSLPGYQTPVDMVDISTTFSGLKFKNPFGLASAPPTTSYPMIMNAFEEGWGFAVTKTFGLDKDTIINVTDRISKLDDDEKSYHNIEMISEKSAQYWVEGAKEVREKYPDHVLVGSIMAGNIQEDWEELAELCNEAGFQAIELNLSCPHGMPDKGMGRACGEDPDVVRQITKWVTDKTNVPVFPKMTPNAVEISRIADASVSGGAQGVTAINTFHAMLEPKSDGTPVPAIGEDKQSAFGGTAGRILAPIARRKILEIKTDNPNMEVMGSGGVTGPSQALAMLRSGAGLVQVCAEVQSHGFGIIHDLVSGLKADLYFMQREDLKEKGWDGQHPPTTFMDSENPSVGLPEAIELAKTTPKVSSFIGSVIPHFTGVMNMDFKSRTDALIDDELCTQCNRCFTTCEESGYQAIKIDDITRNLKVDPEDCTGCKLCTNQCPVDGAITMVPRDTDYTPKRGIAPNPIGINPDYLETIKAKQH